MQVGQEFACIITPTRDNFMVTMTLEEKEIIAKHYSYWQQPPANIQVKHFRETQSQVYRVIIFCANNEEMALEFFYNDPIVKNEVARVKLHYGLSDFKAHSREESTLITSNYKKE